MRPFKVHVTFEHNTLAPKTWKGTVSAQGHRKAISLGLREASRTYPRTQWHSLVVVVEKLTGENAT